MKILAIETSCDETAIALLSAKQGSLDLKKNQIYSQIDIHKKYGGVVPEIAARKHLETIMPLLDSTIKPKDFKKLDYIAVTQGPGLITSLLLGTTVAKTLAFSNNLPLVPVNHIEGHIYSNWLSHNELVKQDNKYFPALILIVSGGHTELVLMKGHGQYQILGKTLDDAVGEAFDKVAKLMELGYPGGPEISKLAPDGDHTAYKLPRPMINNKDYNFSFAGLKTAVLYALEKDGDINEKEIKNMCSSFQTAVVDVLMHKTFKATEEFKVKSIMIAGGVSANTALRQAMQIKADQIKLPLFYPDLKFTGDNAAMIAVAAYYKIIPPLSSRTSPPRLGGDIEGVLNKEQILSMQPKANWQLTQK
jgi:N6-L-threonylcarbamoyladenine synthase